MKLDIYKNIERWESWKEAHYNSIPSDVRKEDWKLLVEFLKDMELGINVPKEKKGKRDPGTLLNLSSHNLLFLRNFKKPLTKLTKLDLHNFENQITQGKIKKKNGKDYTAFGNYIKDFKVFWNYLLRTNKVKENIVSDITSKTDKPAWVYLNEEQIKHLFNNLSFDYRVYCWFLYDSGMRVTEALNIKIKDLTDDYTKVTISEESAKTFGRTINLKLCTQYLSQFITMNNLKSEDYLIRKKAFNINKYLRRNCLKVFGDRESHPKARGNYKQFTMYDIRHNSVCYWFNRYPTAKGLMYRFGWRKADKIEYYSEFLGVADEIKDSDLVIGEDKNKLVKLESQVQELTQKLKEWDDMKDFIKEISGLFSKGRKPTLKEALALANG